MFQQSSSGPSWIRHPMPINPAPLDGVAGRITSLPMEANAAYSTYPGRSAETMGTMRASETWPSREYPVSVMQMNEKPRTWEYGHRRSDEDRLRRTLYRRRKKILDKLAQKRFEHIREKLEKKLWQAEQDIENRLTKKKKNSETIAVTEKEDAKQMPQPAQQLPQPMQQVFQSVQQISQPTHQIPQLAHQISQTAQQIPQPAHKIPQPAEQIHQPVHQIHQPAHQIHQPVQQIPKPVQQIPQPSKQFRQPSKQLPENASSMNPVMLLLQMKPDLHFMQSQSVDANNKITYTFMTDIDGILFSGEGPSMKKAKYDLAVKANEAFFGIVTTYDDASKST